MALTMSRWSLQPISVSESEAWRVSKQQEHQTMLSHSLKISKIYCFVMAGKLIDATLTWSRTCSTRMFCMWFQSGYLDFTHLFQQQRFTICGFTSYTMLCLQPCLSFGLQFSIGNMISRRTLMTLSCTGSVSTMCSSASQCFGVGLCMLVGRVSYCSWFVSLQWTRHKSNLGKLEGWQLSATLCFALWLWLSTSSC